MTGSCGTLFDTPDKPREILCVTKALEKRGLLESVEQASVFRHQGTQVQIADKPVKIVRVHTENLSSFRETPGSAFKGIEYQLLLNPRESLVIVQAGTGA